MRVGALIETEPALAHERRAVPKTNLAAVSVARERKRNAAPFSFIKEIRVMRQKKMGWAVFGCQPIPIGLPQDPVVDSTENEPAVSMRQDHRLVPESPDPYRAEALAKLCRIAAEIVMVAVAIPGAQRRTRQRSQRG